MKACLFVGLGGAIGSMLRYCIGLINLNDSTAFPYKTMIINVVGSFLIGLVVAFAGSISNLDANLLLFLKVGICGGFTTFSTFAFESSGLIQSGKIGIAMLYIILSVMLSIGAIFGAQIIVK